MIRDFSVLALVPARAGSRGIPRKNTVQLGGQPLIQWTIDAAIASRYVDRVAITTDDPEVKRIAAAQGLHVLDRPASIARDETTAAEVIAHALASGVSEDLLIYLQPTSPLRESTDIDRCLELLADSTADAVLSVTAVTQHPEWMYRIDAADHTLEPIVGNHDAFRRQDLPPSVRLNGAIYCAPSRLLRPDGNIFRLSLAGYQMPIERSVDIDEPADLAVAERALRTRSR